MSKQIIAFTPLLLAAQGMFEIVEFGPGMECRGVQVTEGGNCIETENHMEDDDGNLRYSDDNFCMIHTTEEVTLDVQDFDVELSRLCDLDHLLVTPGHHIEAEQRYCGRGQLAGPHGQHLSPQSTLIWKSDHTIGYGGFKICAEGYEPEAREPAKAPKAVTPAPKPVTPAPTPVTTVLKPAVPQPAPPAPKPVTPAPKPYPGCFKEDVDYHGNDIADGQFDASESATPEDCQARCAANSECNVFTHHKLWGCHLKTSIRDGGNEVQEKDTFVSGPKYCNPEDCMDETINPGYKYTTASSVWAGDAIGSRHGLGRLHSSQAWSAAKNKRGQWWQIDAGEMMMIKGVHTQRRANGPHQSQRVTAYRVKFSKNGNKWENVDNGRTFSANVEDTDDIVSNFFDNPVRARYIRIIVHKWADHISMRSALEVDPCTEQAEHWQ